MPLLLPITQTRATKSEANKIYTEYKLFSRNAIVVFFLYQNSKMHLEAAALTAKRPTLLGAQTKTRSWA